jgi:hypothetical protein
MNFSNGKKKCIEGNKKIMLVSIVVRKGKFKYQHGLKLVKEKNGLVKQNLKAKDETICASNS